MSPRKEKFNALLLHVHIDGIVPPIWRRLLVPTNLSLGELHHVLQAAMGWEDEHLHDFRQGKGRAMRMIASAELADAEMMHTDVDVPNEYEVMVSDVLTRKGSTITYVYDYGDHWAHVLRLEERVSEQGPLPRCIEGERAGPPEDAGGVAGYQLCLEAQKAPESDPERAEWLEGWDPDHLDLEQINLDIADRLSEPDPCDGAMTPEVLEFLMAPNEFGVTVESIERFKDAAADLANLLPDAGEVAGHLSAPDAGFPEGVLAITEAEDTGGAWAVSLFESPGDYLYGTPGDDHEPRRMLAVCFQLTSMLPRAIRRVVGPGVLPVPMVLLADGVKAPNHEEVDLLSACLEILAESLGQWDAEDALPPAVSQSLEITDRQLEIVFTPDAGLSGREGDEDGEPIGLTLGFEDREEHEDEEDLA